MFGDVERQWRNVYVFFTRKGPVVRVESFKLVIPRFKRATVPSKMKHRDANDACTYTPTVFWRCWRNASRSNGSARKNLRIKKYKKKIKKHFDFEPFICERYIRFSTRIGEFKRNSNRFTLKNKRTIFFISNIHTRMI